MVRRSYCRRVVDWLLDWFRICWWHCSSRDPHPQCSLGRYGKCCCEESKENIFHISRSTYSRTSLFPGTVTIFLSSASTHRTSAVGAASTSQFISTWRFIDLCPQESQENEWMMLKTREVLTVDMRTTFHTRLTGIVNRGGYAGICGLFEH